MRLGLALGGGGLKGAAHLGVLKTLVENGIKPDIVVGTSAGSIAAALYSAGLLPLVNSITTLPLYNAFNLDNYRFTGMPLGFINGGTVENLLKRTLGNRTFADLHTLTAAVACDLVSGETVVYTNGQPLKPLPPDMVLGGDVPVWQAVRASISVPVIFAPFKIGSRLLVDGGLTDNVPADITRCLGADKVIAVDLGGGVPSRSFSHAGEVILQSLDIMGRRNTALTLKQHADLVLQPVKKPVAAWDISQFANLISSGIAETQRNLKRIQQLLTS
ncbi:MAG: hypothetical protein GX039_08080 [Clostridia bacterium]|nr:hypothetical protein [Clostridia bacterium]